MYTYVFTATSSHSCVRMWRRLEIKSICKSAATPLKGSKNTRLKIGQFQKSQMRCSETRADTAVSSLVNRTTKYSDWIPGWRPKSKVLISLQREEISALSRRGIATGYGLDSRDPVGARHFSTPRRPDRFWGPPGLLSNGYWRHFPQRKSDRSVDLTTHLQLMSRSKIRGSTHPLAHTSSWPSTYFVKHRENFTFYSTQTGSGTTASHSVGTVRCCLGVNRIGQPPTFILYRG
jgi:hypothetical protein